MAEDLYEQLHAAFRWQVPEDFNIAEACCGRWARGTPKATAIYFDSESGCRAAYSYAQLQRAANRLSNALLNQGVRRGHRVAIVLPQRFETAVAHIAIQQIGAVAMPLSMLFGAEALEYRLQDSGAVLAIVACEALPALREVKARCQALRRVLVVGDSPVAGDELPWMEALQAEEARFKPVATKAGDPAILIYTSGTTGNPKGCMHRHRSLQHNVFAGALWANVCHEDVVLGVVPMFHITGMVVIMHGTLACGAALVLMPRWQREYAARLIAEHRVTRWTNIPTMVIDLLASPQVDGFDLSSMISIGGGGAAMPQAIAERLWQRWGLRYQEGYGLTETAAPSHSNPYDAPKQQCLGVPYVSCDARVVDPDTLRELPAGESGEIIVHGPMVFDGYWRRPDATAAAFVELDGKRFFRTGDIGYADADGYFFMTDRLKRMINASGFKVWPSEVETLMHAHPGIAEACIISSPDAYRGETVKAVVVRRAGHESLTAEQLRDWCKANMAAYKVPALVEFADSLPKSGAGKVMWRALQERERAKG